MEILTKNILMLFSTVYKNEQYYHKIIHQQKCIWKKVKRWKSIMILWKNCKIINKIIAINPSEKRK